MEKKITITVTDEGHQIQIENMDTVEAFGLLAFYKETVLAQAMNLVSNTKKKAKTTKFKDNKKEVAHKRITALCEHFDIPKEAATAIRNIASDSYITGSNDAHENLNLSKSTPLKIKLHEP
jgi:hypothetical protein